MTNTAWLRALPAGIGMGCRMSDFVDYRKRPVTLPAGCKDLMDVLLHPGSSGPTATAPAAGLPAAKELAVVTHGQQWTGSLAQVERHLRRFFEARSELSTLMISSAAEDLTLMFYLRGLRQVFVLILLGSDAQLERTVRQFYGRRGIQPRQRYPIPRQEGGGLGWGLVFPMPSLLVEVAEVTGELLRVAGGGPDADFHFRYYQPVAPARGLGQQAGE